jgi:Nitrile hydratase, alpha chain
MPQLSQARIEIEAVLIAKAQTDPAFRQALVNNAKATIEKEFGVALAAESQLNVVEETTNTNYLVLPAVADSELSDADLESVAGGASIFAMLHLFNQQAIIADDSLKKASQNADADMQIVKRSRTLRYP